MRNGTDVYDCMVYYQNTWMRGRVIRPGKDGGLVVRVKRLNSMSKTNKTFPVNEVMMNR